MYRDTVRSKVNLPSIYMYCIMLMNFKTNVKNDINSIESLTFKICQNQEPIRRLYAPGQNTLTIKLGIFVFESDIFIIRVPI